MNEPDLNHFAGIEIPRLPAQLLLVLSSLFLSLMLAGAAFGFTDQNADLRTQRQDSQERQRRVDESAKASAAAAAAVAASSVMVARADTSARPKTTKPKKEHAR